MYLIPAQRQIRQRLFALQLTTLSRTVPQRALETEKANDVKATMPKVLPTTAKLVRDGVVGLKRRRSPPLSNIGSAVELGICKPLIRLGEFIYFPIKSLTPFWLTYFSRNRLVADSMLRPSEMLGLAVNSFPLFA